MLRWILVLFVVVPLTELYLLLWLSSLIGFWPTVALVLVTGVLGGSFAKREGIKVWREWRAAMHELRPPEQGVIDGVLVLLGGVFLIAPGVLTDAAGVCLLIPATRKRIAARVRRAIDRRLAAGQISVIRSATVVDFGAQAERDVDFRPRIEGDVIETVGESLPSRRDP